MFQIFHKFKLDTLVNWCPFSLNFVECVWLLSSANKFLYMLICLIFSVFFTNSCLSVIIIKCSSNSSLILSLYKIVLCKLKHPKMVLRWFFCLTEPSIFLQIYCLMDKTNISLRQNLMFLFSEVGYDSQHKSSIKRWIFYYKIYMWSNFIMI